ncbi:MAG: zinc ribbon domain-containing protein [Solirubrobacteraceae bacterium]
MSDPLPDRDVRRPEDSDVDAPVVGGSSLDDDGGRASPDADVVSDREAAAGRGPTGDDADSAQEDDGPGEDGAPAAGDGAAEEGGPVDGGRSEDDLATGDDLAAVDEPDDEDADEDEIDDEVAPPVIGCLRCGARVPLGSRYCPSCGVPLPRSGEHAATALSRTRRNAPWPVRILVPLIVIGIVGLILSQTVFHDADAAYRSDLRDGLEQVLDANRSVTAELDRLTNRTEDVSGATDAAHQAVVRLGEVTDEISGLDVPATETGRHREVLAAIDTDLRYLRIVETVLRDPSSSELDNLGSRSARAVAALREVRSVADGRNAIGGTRELGQWVRAQQRGMRSGGGSTTSKQAGGFLTAATKVIDDGRPVQRDAMRAFALMRAARDGIAGFDTARGTPPTDASAAIVEARDLFGEIAEKRDALAADAEGLTTGQENERQLAIKLAAVQTAAAATARGLRDCIGEGTPSDPAAQAARCITGSRDASDAETKARTSFREGIDPARRAAGLRSLDAAF